MTLTLAKSPSITGFTHLSFMFKTISRFNLKHHSGLSDIVSIRSLSLYPFFFLVLKRNNSLSTDKELFPIGQKPIHQKTLTYSGNWVSVYGKTLTYCGKQIPVYANTLTYRGNRVSVYASTLTYWGKRIPVCASTLICCSVQQIIPIHQA